MNHRQCLGLAGLILLTFSLVPAHALEYLDATFTAQGAVWTRSVMVGVHDSYSQTTTEIDRTITHLHSLVSQVGSDSISGSIASAHQTFISSMQLYPQNSLSGTLYIDQSSSIHTPIAPAVPPANPYETPFPMGDAGTFLTHEIILRVRISPEDNVTFRSLSRQRDPLHGQLGNNIIPGTYSELVLLQPNGMTYGSGLPLYAGDWQLYVRRTGHLLQSNSAGDFSASSSFAASWTFNSVFPGETADNPLVASSMFDRIKDRCTANPASCEDKGGGDGDGDHPEPVTGSYLKPVVGNGLGRSSSYFVSAPMKVAAGPADGALLTGYKWASEFSAFTSIVFPTLPSGMEALTLTFGEETRNVIAGQEIDLGPEGINEFSIAGFDPESAGDVIPNLVMGLKFAEDGLASIEGIGTLFIPPGDFDENGFVNGRDFLAWQRNPELGSLADWQNAYGSNAPTAEAVSPVPEPGCLVLMTGVVFLMPRARRCFSPH